jgi:hypothetical protein
MWQRLAKVLVVLGIALVAVIGFASKGAAPVAAADACSTTSVTPVTLTFTNNSGAPVNIYWSDLNCNEVQYFTSVANGATVTQASFVTHPWIVRDASTGNALLCFVATGDQSVTINGGAFVNNCGGTDGRLNLGVCDNQVAVYQSQDTDGKPSLDVWGIDIVTDANNQTSTVGRYLFTIDQSDISDFQDTLPTENTRLESQNGVRAYILNSGEIQINSAPDAHGKECVLIFDALQPGSLSHYTFDNFPSNVNTEATAEATTAATTAPVLPTPTATP